MVAIMSLRRHSRGCAAAWVMLLALGQLADLLTTQAAMSRGAIEGNAVAAVIMGMGGLGLLGVVKSALVAAMAAAMWAVTRYWDGPGDRGAALAAALVYRGLQLCVVILAATALNNLNVLRSMAS